MTQDQIDSITELTNHLIAKDSIIASLKVELETAEASIGALKLSASVMVDELKAESERLKKGENDWWRKRWQNNDCGQQLQEIRQKWLTAYEVAENWLKLYDESKIEISSLKARILQLEVALREYADENNWLHQDILSVGMLVFTGIYGNNGFDVAQKALTSTTCYCDQCTGKAPVSGIHVFQGLPIPDSVKME